MPGHSMLMLACLLAGASPASAAATKPHVVVMVLDDIGWSDLSVHDSDFRTPNLDALINDGIFLDRYYVQPVCSPTRSAIMTGRYPFHTGMQHFTTLCPGTKAHLPTEYPTIAEVFKGQGYSTHVSSEQDIHPDPSHEICCVARRLGNG